MLIYRMKIIFLMLFTEYLSLHIFQRKCITVGTMNYTEF